MLNIIRSLQQKLALPLITAFLAVALFGIGSNSTWISEAYAQGEGGHGGGGNGGEGDGNQIDFSKPKIKRSEPAFELPSQRKQKLKEALAPEIRELAGFIQAGVTTLRNIREHRDRFVRERSNIVPALRPQVDRTVVQLDEIAAKVRAELKGAAIQLDTYLALAGIETGSSAMVSRASSQAKSAGR